MPSLPSQLPQQTWNFELSHSSMEGMTDFLGANEYFILWRDSQVINLALIIALENHLKAAKRSAGCATDEIGRGTGT